MEDGQHTPIITEKLYDMISPMKKKSKKTPVMMDFVQLSLAWLAFTAGSVVVTLFANLFFSRAIVLGNHFVSPFWGAVYAMAMVSLITVGVMPIIEQISWKKKLNLTSSHWIVMYWVINSGAIWVTARFTEFIGMGINSWLVAVALGFVLDLVQGGLMMHVVSKVNFGEN